MLEWIIFVRFVIPDGKTEISVADETIFREKIFSYFYATNVFIRIITRNIIVMLAIRILITEVYNMRIFNITNLLHTNAFPFTITESDFYQVAYHQITCFN